MTIILCTTFRDFKGTDNDKIQYMFLDNIKNQSFQDFKIVTTTFGEKKVKDVVDGYFGSKSIVREVELPSNYRFSLSDVVLSGIEELKNTEGDCIFVWCTCDIQLEHTFFKTLVDNYTKDLSGIVHPNIIYDSLDSLKNNKGIVGSIAHGIDLLFFDKETILKAESDIKKYRFYDWGVFEWFLVAIGRRYSNNRINLFSQTKIKKIINNRELTNESKEYFKRCISINQPIFDSYILETRLSNNSWDYMCYNAHRQYHRTKPTLFSEYVEWFSYFLATPEGQQKLSKYHMCRVANWLIKNKTINYYK